jgi:hypothetical protein
MVSLSVREDVLRLEVKGLDKLWAMRSRLDIPLSSVAGVRADPALARGVWKGVSAPGTHIPGIITAGTFYRDDKKIFWDVHDPQRTIIIDLVGQRYDQLIIEVLDPAAAVELVEVALGRAASATGG